MRGWRSGDSAGFKTDSICFYGAGGDSSLGRNHRHGSARWQCLNYLKPNGMVIVNSHPVKPVTESLNDTGYDGTEMISFLRRHYRDTYVVDSHSVCREFGSLKFFNIIILGMACGLSVLGVDRESLIGEIEKKVKEKFVEVNKKAFDAGYKLGENYVTD